MARKTPNQKSRRRENETLTLRVNGNPTRLLSSSTPRAMQSQLQPSSLNSSANRPTATERVSRTSTNKSPSLTYSLNEERSVTESSTPVLGTPIVHLRERGRNDDSLRVNCILEPLLQAGGENERPPNDGAGAGLILQQLNMFFDRQEQFNERLEQKIVAFEEKSEKRRERKAPSACPRHLIIMYRLYSATLLKDAAALYNKSDINIKSIE